MYSQHDEELCILENCSGSRLLDIGAWNCSTFSNSRALIDRGWHAVLVEPSPGPFAGLVEAHRHNPNVTLVNALIGTENFGLTKFYVTPDAISTTKVENCEIWGGVKNFREILMAQVHVDEIAKLGPFDFITVDTEGSSVKILQALDLTAMKANLICVEHDKMYSEIEKHFAKHGFKTIYSNGTNIIGKKQGS